MMKLIRLNPGLTERFPQLPKDREQAETFVDHQNALRVSRIPGADTYVQEGGPAFAGTFPTPPNPPRRKCCGQR